MTKEFAPYELAVKLKELGFDELCFGYYLCKNSAFGVRLEITTNWIDLLPYDSSSCKAPIFSQAFRWFREEHGLCIVIKPIDDKKLELGYNLLKNGLMMGSHLTYEEAEVACLTKLIELVEPAKN